MTTLSASISVNDVTVRYNNGHTAIYDVSFTKSVSISSFEE